MIISASRRTDIPSHYSKWFFNRIREGFVLVRNPMNIHQVSKIKLTPDVVDAIVFWTKNPLPMIDGLKDLADYTYYFQFTVTPYGKDIEPSIPSKTDGIVPAFKRLSDKIGAEKIIWRYDPILINAKYSVDYHVRAFEKIAKELHEYTRKVTISFIDKDYLGLKNNINEMNLFDFTERTQADIASKLAAIAHAYELSIDTCAEAMDLRQYGVEHARCIDDRLLADFLGCELKLGKDKNQRLECGCASSIDIGMYNTCRNGCLYCYANYNPRIIGNNYAKHDPFSPLLSGEIGEGDKVSERAVKSCRDPQMRIEHF